jgi:predicted nucleotidyltransferase
MLHLSKSKLLLWTTKHDTSLSELARTAGISRQSLYNMFGRHSVFNSSFVKLLHATRLPYRELTEESSPQNELLAHAPRAIQRVSLRLVDYCRSNSASLLLFGSRVTGKRGPHVDWDFAVWFRKKQQDRSLRVLKTELQDLAFPYRIDLVNLNQAPPWFRHSVEANHAIVYGRYP